MALFSAKHQTPSLGVSLPFGGFVLGYPAVSGFFPEICINALVRTVAFGSLQRVSGVVAMAFSLCFALVCVL